MELRNHKPRVVIGTYTSVDFWTEVNDEFERDLRQLANGMGVITHINVKIFVSPIPNVPVSIRGMARISQRAGGYRRKFKMTEEGTFGHSGKGLPICSGDVVNWDAAAEALRTAVIEFLGAKET